MTQRNLIVSVDGTGNDEIDEPLTNVYKLHDAIDTQDGTQIPMYHRGVGNEEDNNWLGQKLGFNFGIGGGKIKDKAYADLARHYQPGDRIYIFGFSRGAALVRDLVNRIYDDGINGATVEIEMLGIWDTVAAFGIPIDLGPLPFQRINLFHELKVPPNVKKTYHLVSIDEMRTPFIPTLTNVRPDIEEIWFAGTHVDIGGGIAQTGLSDICLKFMIERTQEEGLKFNPAALAQIQPDVTVPIFERPDNIPTELREIFVMDDDKETERPPKIHHSVLERMNMPRLNYHPKNLEALNGRFEVIGPDFKGQ